MAPIGGNAAFRRHPCACKKDDVLILLQAHPPAHPDDAGVRVQMTRHYMRLFCFEILDNDCSIYMKEKDEEGGPGMSSSVFWYFTPYMDTLRAKVEQWTRHVQADDAEKSTCSTEPDKTINHFS